MLCGYDTVRLAAEQRQKYRCSSGQGWQSEMRGKSTFDLVRSGQLGEMRGKSTFDLVRSGQQSEMRGKSTFDLARNWATEGR
ncbi:hypothetical protein AMQ84_14245 [Paenibacillus riograndensis]|uniref:Uncharacterized protein n=1 Tax=Paenibacillus riograndensis TaxID=483937 RepID=A0A132TZQ8_9BACL|nr:hypothetical protein AMQ84_14245 [Paenibacillus riograndensis]